MNFKLKKKIIPCFYGKLKKKKKFSEQSVSEEGGSGACGDEHCLVGGRRLRTGGKPGFVGGWGLSPRGRAQKPERGPRGWRKSSLIPESEGSEQSGVPHTGVRQAWRPRRG